VAINLQLLFDGSPPELCADGIAVGPDALFVGSNDVRPEQLHAVQAEPRPTGPGLTTLVPLRADVPSWPRTRTYLDLYPPESLDKTVFHLPTSVVGPQSLAGLGRTADGVGVPVRYAAADLIDDPDAAAPPAEYRVIGLDDAGEQADLGSAAWVQVAPAVPRARGAYENLPDADVWLGDHHARLLLVPTADGVQFGLPTDLVTRFYKQALRANAITTPPIADPFAATGTTPTDAGGLSALHLALQNLPPEGHALVEAGGVYLVIRDPHTGALATIDVPGSTASLLPHEPGPIRFAELPGTMSAADRMAGLRDDIYGARSGSFAADTRDGLELFTWTTGSGEPQAIEIFGPRAAIEPYLGKLAAIAEELDQPIVVAGVERPGDRLDEGIAGQIDARIEVYGFDAVVPLVVTLADLAHPSAGPLLSMLDTRNASVAYQAPGLSTGDGGLLANLGAPPWAVREPRRATPAKVADDLAPDLVLAGGAVRRTPAFEPPSPAVAGYLTTGLTEPETVRESFGRFADGLEAEHSEVTGVAGRVPAYGGHEAMIGLARDGHLDSTLAWIGDRSSPGAMVKPLLDVAATASEDDRGQQVRTMLPQLAKLAGHGLGDLISQRIAQTISDLIEGLITEDQAREAIFGLAGLLPQDTDVRLKWILELRTLSQTVPQFDGILTHVGDAIMKCP